jgi:hypothetical protein
MNHPENITFILVVDYFAKKKYEKQNETAISASCFVFADLYAIVANLYASLLSTYVLNFRRQNQAPCKYKYKFQNYEKAAVLTNSQATQIQIV